MSIRHRFQKCVPRNPARLAVMLVSGLLFMAVAFDGCASKNPTIDPGGRDGGSSASGGAPVGSGGSGGSASGTGGSVPVSTGGTGTAGSGGTAQPVAGTGGTTGGTGGAVTATGGGTAVGGSSSGGATNSGSGGAGGAAGGTAPAGGAAGGRLDIYWIDVEGGAATLMVAPSGQTLLVDGGFPGNGDRDLNRILSVLNNQVRATKLDYVITTHFHSDHVGGVTALASRFPVGQFMDHGPSVEGGNLYASYVAALAGKTRVMVRAGDRLQLGSEVELHFLSSSGQLIEAPAGAAANPHCAGATKMPERPTDENPQSVGFVAHFGSFDFLDLGDLTWAVEDRLACPTNRVGLVDLFQVSHHGMDSSSPPQLVHGVAPLVAVMNNGATKGGAASTFDTLKSSPGIRDIWALHRAINNDAAHNALEPLIANISTSPDAGHFVKASVARDGSFTVTNPRNGETRTYQSR